MIRLEMKNCNMILREITKISALLSAKFDKYEHLRGEKILPCYQIRLM